MAAEIVAQLRGTGANREAGYVRLLQLESDFNGDADVADMAVACAPALSDVLRMPASEVDVEEYHRVLQVLTALTGVDPGRVAGACWKADPEKETYQKAMLAKDTVLGAVLAKEPSSLSAADALTISWSCAPFCVSISTSNGMDAMVEAAGVSVSEMIGELLEAMFLTRVATPSDDRNLALAPLLLGLLKTRETLPDFALGAVLGALLYNVMGRPAVAKCYLEHDAVAVIMDVLREVSPAELITTAGFSRRPHGHALYLMKDLIETSQAAGVDLPAQMLSCGFIDIVISVLSAVEEVGAQNTNASAVVTTLILLPILDGPALPQIEDKLRTIPHVLHHVKESNINWSTDLGFTSGAYASITAANLWGKDEDGPFEFSQHDIDTVVVLDIEFLRCETWGGLVPVQSNRCRGLLSLCISDSAKQMLLSNAGFIPHLIDGLLLDPEHPRKDTDVAIKTAVQRDFAECMQQISLFPAGLEALATDASVVDALDALVEQAWSEEAKDCARGALMQLVPDRERTGKEMMEIDPEAPLHIMISYQWDVQRTIQRIVAELQLNGYLVWFDLERMKGSVMDRMSEAVEGACLILYGVSERYKESANCRLELSYGMNQHCEMIPLMMQENYRPNGWLGLILGQNLYHAFYDSVVSSESLFAQQMAALTREVGDRGRIKTNTTPTKKRVSEGVPPAAAPAPVPAPAPAPASARRVATSAATLPAAALPTPQRALAPAPTVEHHGYSPSVQQQLSPMVHQHHQQLSSAYESPALVEKLLGVMERHQADLKAAFEQQRQELQQQRKEIEATKMDAKDARIAELTPVAAISEEQLTTLQARLERLHVAKLLTDDELYSLEDFVADYVELTITMAKGGVITKEMAWAIPAAGKAEKLVGLSAAMAGDGAFCRQIRRKFL